LLPSFSAQQFVVGDRPSADPTNPFRSLRTYIDAVLEIDSDGTDDATYIVYYYFVRITYVMDSAYAKQHVCM
jgi:hypothetical protein